MKVRTIGSIRVKKTVIGAVALEPALDPRHLLRADVEDVVALEQLLAPPVADRVAGPGADDVAEHARRR